MLSYTVQYINPLHVIATVSYVEPWPTETFVLLLYHLFPEAENISESYKAAIA